MPNKLEDYLEEIDHFLAVHKGGPEILENIKLDILKKAGIDSAGEVDEATLLKTIEHYGSPREVASRYLDKDHHIISPIYKKYLLHYTGILFLFHATLTITAFFLKMKIQAFPIFYVPAMENFFDLASQLSMTLVYDLALVGVIFYLVTQSKQEFKLSWFNIFSWKKQKNSKKSTETKKKVPYQLEKPRVIYLVLMILGLGILLFLYFKHGTIFFKSLNPGKWEPLLDPMESSIISLLVISLLSLEVFFYIIRFVNNTPWLNLAKNFLNLVVLLTVVNFLISQVFTELTHFDKNFPISFVVRVIIVGLALDSLIILINILRSRNQHSQLKKPIQ